MVETHPNSRIKVVIRKRPLSTSEDSDILEQRSPYSLVVKEAKTKLDLTRYIEEHSFTFDGVFDQSCGNEVLYQRTLQPLVHLAVQGVRITCFAYGQTGSGKTYTTMGETACPGLFTLAVLDLFRAVSPACSLQFSFYEIYCGRLYDLLNSRKKVHTREDANHLVNIIGLSRHIVIDPQSLFQLMTCGMALRTTGSTGANETSSRSHAVLDIELWEGKERGRLTFIDLAGSERGADVRDACKQTRVDGAEINKSLLVLKECFRALDQEQKHPPFRGSKLTQVLKDSLLGRNCRTLMVGCVSPGAASCEHTLNTLRYADRVKELRKRQRESLLSMHRSPISDENCPPCELFSKLNVSQDGNSRECRDKLVLLSTLTQRDEEELVRMHRECIKEELESLAVTKLLLREYESNESDVFKYLHDLSTILEVQKQSISRLRPTLHRFQRHLVQTGQFSPSTYLLM